MMLVPTYCPAQLNMYHPAHTIKHVSDTPAWIEVQSGTSSSAVPAVYKFKIDTFISVPTKSVSHDTELVLISVHIYGILTKIEKKDTAEWQKITGGYGKP